MSGKRDQKSDREEMLVGFLATGMPKARAARSLLEMAVRYRDAVSIEDRLQALEDRLGGIDHAKH